MSLHEFQWVDDVDALFDALADSRRREVLRVLDAADSPMALADLATEIAARELDVPTPDVERERVRRARTSLYHVHVPKLASAGLLEFDPDRRTVTLATPVSAVDRMDELPVPVGGRSND